MTKAQGFPAIWLIALATALLANWPQLGDPFVRHDDFPVLTGDAAAYYEKTLAEGRWLNYLWALRPVGFSPVINYFLYLVGWSAFAAAFATLAVKPPLYRVFLAVLIVLTPQAYELSQWFSTTLPGVWLLALHAGLSLARPRWSVPFMLAFVPLTFSAYPTFPFIVLATALTTTRKWRTPVALFLVSFALAVLIAYGLNWLNHGYFVIKIAAWRNPDPATTFAEALENLAALVPFVFLTMKSLGMGHTEIGLAILTISTLAFWLVFTRDPRAAALAVTPIALGLTLLTLNQAQSGVPIPVRATVFVWIGASLALVRAAMILPRRSIGIGVLIVITGFLGYQFIRNHLVLFERWQTSTRALAATVPTDAEAVHVYGERWTIDGAADAAIQSDDGLSSRLRILTGLPVTICLENCEDTPDGGTFVIRLPDYTP